MRARSFKLARSLVIALTIAAVTGCGSSGTSSDTTAAADATLALETTVAPDTTAVASAPAETSVADTTVAALRDSATTVVAGDADTAVVSAFLQQMNGGKTPSAEDISCVTKAIDPSALGALIASSTGSSSPDPKVLLPVMKGIFTCKPSGLADSMSSSFDTMPAGVTAAQKTCIANGLLDVMATEDSLLEQMMNSTGSLKDLPKADRDAVIKKLTPAVDKCVDGALRKEVLADLQN